MNELKGKKIVIIAGQDFEDMELMYPLYRLRNEACADVLVAGLEKGETITGEHGMSLKTHAAIKDLNVDDFDALVIPGGHSPDHLRWHNDVIKFVQDFDRTGKTIAAICHDPQILITAKLLNGKDATCYKSIVVDVENAGAKFIDRPLVKSQQYLFSRNPGDLGFFCDAIINSLSPARSETAAQMAQASP
jgi:protease I